MTLKWTLRVSILLISVSPVLAQDDASEAAISEAQISASVDVVSKSDPGTMPPRLSVLTEGGYIDERGQQVIDALEQEYAYLAVRIQTAADEPIVGVVPSFSVTGSSRVIEPADVSSQTTTDESGVVEFAVVAGNMGLDQVEVSYGGSKVELLVNIISLEAAGYPAPPKLEDGINWDELTRASIRFSDSMLVADFPASVRAQSGKTVKLSGFILPLESELLQRRFLLTSNPPSCFFHIPGGPAGAVEVLAPEGIEVSWDPVVLEGRFETRDKSDDGVLYRLHEARLVKR